MVLSTRHPSSLLHDYSVPIDCSFKPPLHTSIRSGRGDNINGTEISDGLDLVAAFLCTEIDFQLFLRTPFLATIAQLIKN